MPQVPGLPGKLVDCKSTDPANSTAPTRNEHGGLIGVWSLGIAEDRIQSIRSLVNPDKLAHLGPVSGLTAMLENARRDGG